MRIEVQGCTVHNAKRRCRYTPQRRALGGVHEIRTGRDICLSNEMRLSQDYGQAHSDLFYVACRLSRMNEKGRMLSIINR